MKKTPRFSERQLNTSLNRTEYNHRRERLLSTPEMVTLGTHRPCNAACVFCPPSKFSRFSLREYKDFFEARMGRFIRNARQVTFTGWGELLLMPEAEDFLEYLNSTLPDTDKVVTTNGTPLTPGVIRQLVAGRYRVQVSLHASHAKLHAELTGLPGRFPEIVANIETLSARRNRHLHLELIDVLTARNIDDLPDFLRLAWRLRADTARALYMEMLAIEHIPLSCFFDQDRANRALLRARAAAKELRAGDPGRVFWLNLPPRFGITPPLNQPTCVQPWQHIYVELQGPVLPCCHWGEHISNLNQKNIDAVWNGEFHKGLRRGWAQEAPHPRCRKCVMCSGYNVNDLRAHITNRPDIREKIFKALPGVQAAAG